MKTHYPQLINNPQNTLKVPLFFKHLGLSIIIFLGILKIPKSNREVQDNVKIFAGLDGVP